MMVKLSDVLTQVGVDGALPNLSTAVDKYTWIQAHFNEDIHTDREFQKRYNGYYRIRRNNEWQNHYYTLMVSLRDKETNFQNILQILFKKTGRIEASFASKMLATLNPNSPVIDSKVLIKLGLRLPYYYYSSTDRLDRTCKVFETLSTFFFGALSSNEGKLHVAAFRRRYPNIQITDTKILDFLLWKS